MSPLLRTLLLGTAATVFANVGYAQNDVATPLADRPAVEPYTGPSATSDTNGTNATSGTSGTAGASGNSVLVVPVVPIESHASNPATDGSNDPFIQRRKERYRAKMEYKARMHAAKSGYKEEKRDAKADYKADKREANAELRAADTVPADQRNIDGRYNSSGR